MQGKAQITATADGAIVHDASQLGGSALGTWFEPAYWAARGDVEPVSGGRGGAVRVDTPAGSAVLRHYRRGGFVARLNADRYLWQGQDQTRPFLEFRLLQAMHALSLPAPLPLAARYVRSRIWYRADLLTAAIDNAQTLGRQLREQPSAIDWALIGRTIGRFHAAGFFHADLNVHNIMLRDADCWLLDFDRGDQRQPHNSWQQANIARLRRSLDKIGAEQLVTGFERVAWGALRAAHGTVVEGG